MSPFLIYALVDPSNESIFYVGRSSSGLRRPQHHLLPCILKSSKLPVHNKIRQICAKGQVPRIEILEECEAASELNSAEQYYIREERREGHKLFNVTDGGDGMYGHKHSPETREKISRAQKGRHLTPAQIEKMRVAKTGQRKTDKQKEKASMCSPRRRAVLCVDTGVFYDGVRRAAKALCYDHRGIGRCCTGEYQQYKGYTWKFVD